MQELKGLYNPEFEHDACGVGFIARLDGNKTHNIVSDGVRILCNLEHRGAVGGDMKTGDGAGMLIQIPHKFLRKTIDFKLPKENCYGVGMLFLPERKKTREKLISLCESVIKKEGAILLGWRDVPVDPDCLGEMARAVMPFIKQIFVNFDGYADDVLERKLYILRKSLEKEAAAQGFGINDFYISSLSSRVIVYKGMFVAPQFETFFPDLLDKDFESAIALVHQRYSTNTFPSWPLAQPFRYIAHNGEINTLRRNINNMTAREASLKSDLFNDDIRKLFPVTEAGGSDSSIFDNVLELLVQGGRSLEHSLVMMVPEAFGNKYHISEDKRAFFEYHAALMEPWDGPAAIAFTDGKKIGGTLDRNGLRPGRYTITKDGQVIMASETGVIEVDPENIREKGRLMPGKIFVVDTEKHRVIKDNEIKSVVSRRKPYRRWLSEQKIELKGLLGAPRNVIYDSSTLAERMKLFGYDYEDIKTLIIPMAANSQEPLGSMGNDSPLAVLTEKPRLLYDYFRQLFAQVTNPPIDPYRENLVMSLMSFVGRERNLLSETPEHCHQLKLAHPVLTNEDIDHLLNTDMEDFKAERVSLLFENIDGKGILEKALEKLVRSVEKMIDQGASLIILSDRFTNRENVPIPALLAVSAVHHHLVKKGKRHLAGLILESGEVREVQHFATLIAYGCSGINPYLVFETISELKKHDVFAKDLSVPKAIEHYITAVKKGLLKVMSKMGVSTIRSYRGSQIFEAVGLGEELIEKYFTGTSSLIGGIGINELEKELLARHRSAFDDSNVYRAIPEAGGKYSSRITEDKHLFTATAVVNLQKAVRNNDYEQFKQYSREIDQRGKNANRLRGLFKIKQGNPIPLEEVETVDEIVKRFVSGAMSFGSLSMEAHETIAVAMNRLGAKSNSGEGGEDSERYHLRDNGDDPMSHVKQVASGRFGVDAPYLVNCEELQIKMAQGAKPGEGGQLPGHKVNEVIARVRNSTPGVMLISPPPHHDIYSIEDLSQLIFDLKNINPEARVSVKLVSEVGVGTVAAGVAKGKADMVLISSSDAGTGASPLSSIKYAGSFWELGLAETQQILVRNKLRSRIRVQVDGQLRTGRDVVIGALLGAEEFGFGTVSLVCIGCVMMRKCHTNGCPVGIATQNPELRKRFNGKPEYLINYMRFVAREVREIMAETGFRTMDEMVGRADFLEMNEAIMHYKTKGLDFSRVLMPPELSDEEVLRCVSSQEHDFSLSLDGGLIEQAKEALENKKPVVIEQKIRNCNRTVGATLSYELTKRYGAEGLPDDCIRVNFSGSAGQSFGAFLNKGISFYLEGDSNDYLGKGLSGGRIVLYPPKKAGYSGFRNIITGNVNLFGATGGEAFIAGMAGERFAVRNSGAEAVVEGVGDHGCEYMTGGRVIILGKTGVNFAAGMSGGIAYVYDENQLFDTRCNLEMVDVEPVCDGDDIEYLQRMINKHVQLTGSRYAGDLLENWEENLPLFVKVMPLDYRLALEKMKERESSGMEEAAVTEEVY